MNYNYFILNHQKTVCRSGDIFDISVSQHIEWDVVPYIWYMQILLSHWVSFKAIFIFSIWNCEGIKNMR
jgi:hypothetical protein